MKVPNYETETGKIISLYLQGDDTHKDNIDWYFNENRLEVEKEVKALLDQGIPVIMDRSYLS